MPIAVGLYQELQRNFSMSHCVIHSAKSFSYQDLGLLLTKPKYNLTKITMF